MTDHDDLSEYRALIARKRVAAIPTGIRRTPELNSTMFDYQADVTQFALRAGRSALFLDTGLGKQQPLSEPVLTPRGWSAMGALKVGDFVIGSSGTPTEVLGVFPQGVQRVWRLELSDGTFVRCGAEHLWAVRTKVHRYRGKGFQILTTEQIKESTHRDWQLPMFAPAPIKYQCARIIRRVVDEGVDEEQVCIRVAASDSLYVTRDFILTHNTVCAQEWGRCVVEETNKSVLMLAPLGVVHQHLAEANRIGVEAKVSRTGEPPKDPCIVITNYDRLERFDPDKYGGIILDESSILKSYSGVTTKKLIDAFAKTPFRLCCSATPAPNDHTELGQHSQFLGVMNSSEMLSRWFIADQANAGRYRLKKPAVSAYWDWVASWARCLSKPSDLGYSDVGFDMPALNVHKHIIAADRSENSGEERDGQFRLFRLPDTSATSIHAEKRLTKDARATKIAELMAREPNEPWLIWCYTDYDADALKAIMPNLNEVRGSMSPDVKEDRLNAFTKGQSLTMLSKPSICGYGLNWQHCARMAFMGIDFSYESFYQAIRRCWRFRQKRAVEVHIVCAGTEASIWDVVSRKSGDHDKMKLEMSAAMARAHRSSGVMSNYNPKLEASLPAWLMR